jgi:hypothetical protein
MAQTGTDFAPSGGNDTIAWSKWLVEHKVPKAQAEAHAQLIAKALGTSAASKDDLRHTELKLKSEIERVELELQRVESDLKSEIREAKSSLKSELLSWMFGMFIAQTGLIVAILKFL